jgi:hypothetical protein
MLRLATLSSALLFLGCANQGDEGMTVINNTAVSGTTCTLTGDPGQPFKSHGTIYALSPTGYLLTPLIQSRVTLGTEVMADELQKTIFLRGADVNLTLKAVSIETNGAYTVTQPESNVGQFSVLFAGALPPEGSVNVGFEVITPAILRNILGASGVNLSTSSLNAEVLAEVTIRGDLGSDEVTSNPFQYPISVCTDCVVNVTGACPMTGTPRTGDACNIFQDGVVDCCTDANGGLTCPASTATAAN